ncbi:MAG: tetratricopeptide repeat protein [Acidobacteria bacterium]|nr:tetratricopeptide repeat protein [Acidobacteriota bacterium]
MSDEATKPGAGSESSEPADASTEFLPTEYLGPPRLAADPLPTRPAGDGDLRPRNPSPVGSTLGSIRVLERLAMGGVGELYLGYDEKLRRKVVLKALRGDRRSRSWRARLLREARILSQLQDPKICHIYGYVEGEATDYLVLELIEGRTLTQALAEGIEPGLQMRIAQDLAEVLVKAHGRGVIHRDLKPGNVMLTHDGSVKVLDFGIASSEELGMRGGERRDTDELDTSDRMRTLAGAVLGTMAYMSPEQARGEKVTAASDVYSLGLMFQELFTGEHPFGLDSSTEELLPAVLAANTRPLVGVDPDLATLVRRMLAVAPEARPTAADVAERLSWIRAKPRRRLRRIVVLAVTAALALAGVFHLLRLREERNRALESERRAVEARQEAEEVVTFLEEMFEVSDPLRAHGESITAREVLDRGADRIGQELAGQPLVQARLMATMGLVYRGLGLYDRADELLRHALELRRSLLPPGSSEIADSAHRLALLDYDLSRYDEAEALHREALAIHQAIEGPDSRAVAEEERYLAAVLLGQARYDEAEVAAQRALAVFERELGTDDPMTGATVRVLGGIYRRQERYDQALPFLERATAIERHRAQPNPATLALALYNLGIAYAQLGRYDEAEAAYKEMLENRRRAFGPDHPEVAKGEVALATLYRRLGRRPEAEAGLLRAIEIFERSIGPGDQNLAFAANNLASVYLEEERDDLAESYYLKAQAIFEKVNGPEHPNVAMVLANRGQLAWSVGRFDDADRLLRQALALDEKLVGPEHTDVGWDLHVLANLERDRGRYAEAGELYERSFGILDKVLAPDHPDMVTARQEYAVYLRAVGRDDEAERAEAAAPAGGDP